MKKLSALSFFTMTSAMVMTVYVYPTFATAGLGLIFYLLVSGICWFVPTALCSAEMATINSWKSGGIYTWVKETVGPRWAFSAVFFQWFQVTVGFVPMLYFIVGMISIAIGNTAINENVHIKLIIMLVIFWGVTFLQFFGTKITSLLSKLGFFLGVLIPVSLLGIFATLYVSGDYSIKVNANSFLPDFSSISSMVVFVSFILAYLGIEASANEIHNLNNGTKNYPKVMIFFCIVSIAINMIAGIGIAIVIPANEINLSTGIIQAIDSYVKSLEPSLAFVPRVLALILTLSTIAKISTWIVAPSEGLYETAKKGILPKVFTKENKNGIPYPIILVQGILGSIWCIILTLSSSSSNFSFLLSLSLTVLVYLFAYILMYVSYFILVLKKSKLERSYQLFKSKVGKMIFAAIGFATTIFAFVLSFVPASGIPRNEGTKYILLLITCSIITLLVPQIIYKIRKKHISE